MSIESGLRTILLAEGTINTLLGESTNGVYVNQAPQNAARPFILITVMGMDPLKHLGATGGLRFTDIDIDCKADTDDDARALGDAVEAFIDDYTGAAGSDSIKAVLLNGRTPSVEPPIGNKEYGRAVETIDVQIQWTPA